MAHLYISAAHKSSGKTTVSIGLCRELVRLGASVRPFKKGPDYIDPLWLGQASGRTCFNLDFHTMDREEITGGFARGLTDVDVGLIEGNVGLFDAVDPHGSNSNAALAKLLRAPVILVLDVQGMGRGIAPLLLGYSAFDPALNIAGVIANKVGGSRHETNLRRVLEHYTDLPLLGALHRTPEIRISERHLGLIPSNETEAAEDQIERIRAQVAGQVDVPRVLEIARSVPPPPAPLTADQPAATTREPVRIAIARDAAFGFYYPDDLAALARAGAELVDFSPVRDAALPDADGLFIGGGFPEFRLRELSENRSMRAAVRDFVESEGVVYAECGGLMYLCRELHWGDRRGTMCGVLNADVAMYERPQGRGYVRLRETPAFPWPRVSETPRQRPHERPHEIRAHEFHHSAILNPDPAWTFGYQVLRGKGIDGQHDAIVHKNLVAAYSHLRAVGGNDWTGRFVAQIRACRR
ncbi:cobyrinate a,c-diamide synthase [Candidatus Thiosymbion oneisti]|uniref:cobyrinate a,c-diamide synthase n=1 Tax=Candidatus Thiosymbion oneisti TaxID=589554 RepID=UPI000AAFC0CC|nr:cobyrinate a,c-diamide synthase [Candidatus Thiosymbion oneisti]